MRYARILPPRLLPPRQAPAAVLPLLLLSATILWYAFASTARADPGPDEPPTPVATVVIPVVATVVAGESVVTPVTGVAEATTGSAQPDADGGGGAGSLFSGVRGGFIGAGIALGVVLALTAVVRGARSILRRSR
ncbi:MAG: hypothetical protein V3V35_09820 [Dehalococcoidia bacterium]